MKVFDYCHIILGSQVASAGNTQIKISTINSPIINGVTPLKIVATGFFVIPPSANTIIPTGGVIMPMLITT
ncbi:MAG: hypothetical protein MJ092_00415, partial [Lachnospiraceae bacterium]|nr:hypothetical protein [Lachnospiraceae bacterium]